MPSTYTLSATLISSSRPVGGLRVEAWDAEGASPDLIDIDVTDARGQFDMRLDGEYVANMLPRKRPALVFRVFDGARQLALGPRVVWQLTTQATRLQIPLAGGEAAAQPPAAPAPLVVRGTVREADGDPAAGLVVRAFDRNLGRGGITDAELGNARTDEDGRYQIRYTMAPGSGVKPDLIVRVQAPPPAQPAAPPLAESELLRNPPGTARIDLALGDVEAPRRSEFRQIVNRLAPMLKRGGMEITDLNDEGIEFAAEKAKLLPERVRLAKQAMALERKAGGAVPAEIFYGLCRMGHDGGLARIAEVPLATQRRHIEDAIENNIVAASFGDKLDDIAAALQRLMVDGMLAAPRPGRKGSRISRLLGTSLSDRATQTAFLARWLARPGHARDFWISLREDPAFARGAADELELTMRLGMLFDGYLPALAEVRRMRQDGRVKSLRDLAGWDDADWQAFLGRAGGPPPDAPGTTPEERTKAYIDGLQQELQELHPTEPLRKAARAARPPIGVRWVPALLAANPGLDPKRPLPDEPSWSNIPEGERDAARAEWAAFRREALTFRHVPAQTLLDAAARNGGRNPIREAANRVLAGATDLDLVGEHVDAHLTRNPRLLDGVAESLRGAAIDHLKAAQRILRITGKPRAVEPLLADGLDSAFRIVRVPAIRFVRRYADLLGGEAAAKRAYATAYRTAATAQLALTTTSQAVLGPSPWAVRGGPAHGAQSRRHQQVLDLLKSKARGDAPAGGSSSWPDLFGDQAWCACEECQSVYSPAAYFVDLLHMLDDPHDDRDAAFFLFKRRPDLEYLKLSCGNTNTTLPYIDLVNEVLETRIAARHGKLDRDFSYDTGTLSAAELRAVPQNVRDDVYELLKDELYPLSLPFHRPLAVTRTYLAQLGTSYREVLEAFGPADGAHGLSDQERLAAETLGLSTLEFKLIADLTPDLGVAKCYGFDDGDAAWPETLAKVPELLARTGVSYEELVALIKTAFVNPFQHKEAKRVELDAPKDCDLTKTRVRQTSPDTWSRLHRFIRLWRRSGWSIADLDRAIAAVASRKEGAPVLDRETVRRLGLVRRVVAVLDRPFASVLALWSDLDTWGADALYLKLFQSRTLARSEDADAFALKHIGDDQPDLKPGADQHELASANQLLAGHVPTILAALRITEADLDRIWDHAIAQQTIPGRATAPLSLHNLSVLHRYTVLAKALGMRIADLVALLALSGKDPFEARHPRSTLAFAALARKVKASGFSVATLDYLYRHASGAAQGPAPAASEVMQSLMKVWAALRSVRQETEVADDPDGALLATRLALVHPPEVVRSILDALDPAKGLDRTARAQILADHLGEYLGGDAQGLLAPPEPVSEEDKAQRRLANQAVVLERLSRWLRASLSRSAVTSVVAETLGLPEALTRRLLCDWIPGDGGWSLGNPHPALDAFLDLAGGRLGVQYFAGAGLAGAPTAATSSAIELRATKSGPFTSARWSGRLLPLGNGEHEFVLRTDGVARLRVEDKSFAWETLEHDEAKRPLRVDRTATVTLSAATLAPVEVEFSTASAGSIELLWRLASSPAAAPVAPEHLFPSDGFAALDAPGQGPGHVWRRLHKAALLIRGFGLTEPDLEYAEGDGGRFNGFHLRDLPTAAGSDPAHMVRWEGLADYVALRASLPQAETTLAEVLSARSPALDAARPPAEAAAARLAYWTQQLCEASGWDPAAVATLLDPAALTAEQWSSLPGDAILARLLTPVAGPIPADGDLDIGRRLAAARRCLGLARRVGVAVRPTLVAWAAHEPNGKTARQVVRAVRARYEDESEWLEVARTRNDTLREAQRDALVAHLLAHMTPGDRRMQDANELFEHFLIDVEMSPMALTSRIKQAISSVQLFCQRVLLGLEERVDPDAIDEDHWPWMKNYRVWEANRKIFLYPENWIEPELRDGKSPFFEDLESELRQNPLDDAHVEQALVGYLEKLDQVARLEVCAMHWQKEEVEDEPGKDSGKDIDILHVVARTPGTPALFFYRSLINGSEWTPWEKIELDIESEGGTGNVHMVLTSFHRRLYLFWALFSEKAEDEQPGSNEGDSPSPPLTHWEIRVAWSTYRDGKWSPKQQSTDFITSTRFLEGSDRGSAKEGRRYRNAVREAFKELDTLEHAKNRARRRVAIRESRIWRALAGLRVQLMNVLELWTNVTQDVDRDDDEFMDIVYDYLAPLFFHEPGDLPQLEDWLERQNKSFDQFIDDIYDFPKEHPLSKDLPFPPTMLPAELQDELKKAYRALHDERRRRDEARDKYRELKDAKEGFEAGGTALAIPSQRRRRDHTFWLSTRDGLGVTVLRHTSLGRVEKMARFNLSADGRSLHPERMGNTLVHILDDLIPAHSTPQFNCFRIDTSDNKGLDLTHLPNVTRRAKDAVFVAEHWFNRPVTGERPNPFFLSKGRDCHLALPVQEPEEDKPVKRKHRHDKRLPAPTKGHRRHRRPADATYRFEPFHHPFVLSLIRRLNRDGIPGLLTVRAQNPKGADDGGKGGHFDDVFDPHPREVDGPYPPHDIDFRPQGAYSLYNWELFFHAPFLIAVRLMQDQRFEEARDWFHYIFDPTTDGGAADPKRFWKFKPFRENDDYASAEAMLTALSDPRAPAGLVNRVNAQIDQWNRFPANPHRIAGLRLSAYQKAIVFRYLDNLIAWGDSLFMRDTIEAINEATQLYVLAGHLLGPRPERVPQVTKLPPLDYATLRDHLDELSNLLVDVESLVFPFVSSKRGHHRRHVAPMLGISHLPALKSAARAAASADSRRPQQALAFCVPGNDKLLGYWDTVEDRLFKIRHSMNIEGVERQLPLFEPPIDPALLVRAAAAGLDLGSVLADLGAPRAPHRFPTMLQKALDLCAEVRSLGGQLLSALEKRDAESLTLLRATHEKGLLKAVKDVRTRQLTEAEAAQVALQKGRDVVKARHDYYASRDSINPGELAQLISMGAAGVLQFIAGAAMPAAAAAAMTVDVDIGPTGMGAHATVTFGGKNAMEASKSVSEWMNIFAQALHTGASMAGILGGYERRQDEWDHQANLASKELLQIDKQLVAANIRIAIAQLELRNQELQIANAEKVEEVLRSKYTSEQLYAWMLSRIADVHYQAYKLAYDLAKRAERGYRFETGVATSRFIQFGYWDSLRKGLLAGEHLALDLKRLDAAYLEAMRRELEITRQISLVLHDPEAFIKLRETGRCEVSLPEELFDSDYPGHYFRRLKSVSLTLPCVAGPYTPINCTLTLLSGAVRKSASAAKPYAEQDQPNDARFDRDFGTIQSIATSHGQNDAGLFEVNFRDERYLPFEGAGAISKWRIDLPKDCNAFDFDTLSDIVLRVSYTARDGGKPLAEAARDSLRKRWAQAPGEGGEGVTPTTPLRRLFRVRYEFGDAWTAFRNGLATGKASLALTIDQERFPYVFRGKKIAIVELRAFLQVTERAALPGTIELDVSPPLDGVPSTLNQLQATAPMIELTRWTGEGVPGKWTLGAKPATFPVGQVKDLLLLFTYTVSQP